VSAVTRLVTSASSNVDLRDVRIVKKVGGTIDDTELVEGLALHQSVISSAGGPTRMEKAKIGLIQFQLSAPKPDVCPAACKVTSSADKYVDGQPNRRQRLPSNGQDPQRRTTIPPQPM
jgi:chaperonin GroEL (HSP60 family)